MEGDRPHVRHRMQRSRRPRHGRDCPDLLPIPVRPSEPFRPSMRQPSFAADLRASLRELVVFTLFSAFDRRNIKLRDFTQPASLVRPQGRIKTQQAPKRGKQNESPDSVPQEDGRRRNSDAGADTHAHGQATCFMHRLWFFRRVREVLFLRTPGWRYPARR